MKVRRHHVILSTAVLVTLVMLGLAGGFVLDAIQTNKPYEALTAHRVSLSGRSLGCADVSVGGRQSRAYVYECRYSYSYAGRGFTSQLPQGEPSALYVDPDDPNIYMPAVTFNNGPHEIVGDVVIASLLVSGALITMAVHEVHRRRRARRHL